MNVDNNHDHNSNGGAGLRQISPEDFSSSATSFQVGNSSDPSSSNWNQTLPLHIQSSSYAKGGARGMDILAEITCHAPPMPLLQNQTQQQQQHHHLAESIPSYQQIYRQVKHRVSAIPSYQEIYREMGQQQQMSPTSSAYYHHNQKHDYLVESVNDVVSNGSQQQHHHHSTNSHFGHPPRRDDMIEEGKELYTRKDLVTYGGHLCENKDVHGNMKDGCDSIVIANLEKDIREGDGLLWFLFSTDRTNGGGALCRAFHRKLPVRVFRSSTLSGRYAPPYLDDEENEEDDEIAYRYDGLYTIDAVWDVHGNETDVFPCGGVDGWQTYFFTRVPKRPLEKEKHVAGMQYNKLGLQELWGEVQKMRGVRRPKKFEIPMAPMKLPAMKRNAITGQNASRKVGAYRPPSLEELQKKQREEMKQQAKLLKRQQSSSSKGSMNGLRRGDDHSQSSEEVEEEVDEEGNHGDTDGNDSEESESMHHSASPISRKSSSGDKVVTPRPRLNSSATSRSKRNTDYDSSDSESSTTAGRSRRSPTKQMSSPRISATAMDSSLFFPKRASAAKAESANREMFGKKKRPYNRKSTARGGGRKRKKMDESDDDSSDEGDVVDQAVLTIGSRVLVQYKGSLFKATIRKRREKNGKHSFLIHYDGNKKTNVHWVPLEHITEILHICLDAPPPATTSRGGAVKRKTKNAKRLAVQKNNRPHSGSEDETVDEESLSANRKADSKDDVVENKDPDDEGEADKTDSHEQSQLAAVDVEAQDEKQTVEETDDMDIDEPGHSVEDDESLESESKSAVSPMKRQSRKTVVLDLERASPLNKSPEKNKESDEDTSQSTSSSAKPKEEFKYPIGSHVYVEYGRSKVLYHSTVINARKKRTVTEYLVHYDGYKKSANRWVKESTVHEVSSHTTRRFDEQRNVPEEILYDPTSEKSTRGRKSREQEKAIQRPQNKPPRRMRSDISELSSESILGNIAPGVAFLQGSMVFAEWKGVLFLAKMVKKRYSGDRTEYLVSYDGFSSKHDAWVSIHKIYEINHQTKRAFKQLKAGQNAPGAKKRVSHKREEEEEKEDEDDGDDNTVKSVPKKRVYRKRSVEERSIPTSPTRRGSRKKKDDSSEMSAPSSRSSARTSRTSTLDMQGIEPGVDFLPGSTIFAEYKGGLCLAKMIKKRGKGDYMEYYIQYMGLKKSEETWMSVGLLYEINPQTKRMFRQYSKS
jgi:hypothetical protein